MEAIAHELVSPVAWMNLGVVFHAIGDPAKSTRCLRTATKLGPDVAETHHNLALILWDTGRTDEAVIANRKALRWIHPMMRPNNCMLGWVVWDGVRPVRWSLGRVFSAIQRSQAAIANYLRLVGFQYVGPSRILGPLRLQDRTRKNCCVYGPVGTICSRSFTERCVNRGVDTKKPPLVPFRCCVKGLTEMTSLRTLFQSQVSRPKPCKEFQAFLDATNIGPSKPLRAKWEPLLSVIIPTRIALVDSCVCLIGSVPRTCIRVYSK